MELLRSPASLEYRKLTSDFQPCSALGWRSIPSSCKIMISFSHYGFPLKIRTPPCLALLVTKGADQQLGRSWPLLVLDFERALQELLRLGAAAFGKVRTSICRAPGAAAANLEDRLQLRAIRVWVGARHHLDDQAAERPDVGFLGVRRLADDFGRHPEH